MGKEKMPVVPVIQNQIIKHRGLFNFDTLLEGAPDWMGKHNYDFFQKAHSQKKKPGGGYLEATWVAERKVTEYVKFEISVDFWIRDISDVAVEKAGKTVKMSKGNVEITFSSKMVKDYDKRFSDVPGSFSHFLKEMYERYVIKAKLEALEDKLLFETQDLIEHMKKFLKR